MNDPQRDPENPIHIPARESWAERNLEGWHRRANSTWGDAHCRYPNHNGKDSKPSLSVNLQTGGVKCQSGCFQGQLTEYAQATNLPLDGLPSFEKEPEPTPAPKKRKKRELGKEVAWYEYFAFPSGAPSFRQVRFEPKDFRLQHWDEASQSYKSGRAGRGLVPYRWQQVAQASLKMPIFWVEGEKDADNGAQLGLVTTTTAMGADGFEHVDLKSLEVFRDRWVVLVPDNDKAGRDYVFTVAKALQPIARLVHVLTLPGLVEKGDFSDWLLANPQDPKARLKELLRSEHCQEWKPVKELLPRKTISITNRELHELSNEALSELLKWNDPPELFTDRAGQLVRVQRIAEDTNVQPINSDAVRGYLAEAARWVKKSETEGGWRKVPTFPVSAVATDITLRHAERFPVLEEFSRAPVFDRQFRLISTPGYDARARLYADISDFELPQKVPSEPTDADVKEARRWLVDEMLVDFPFVDQASRANACAAVLAPFVRQSFRGPIPLHLIESPTAGTGKGLLASVISQPSTGNAPAIMSDPGADENEWRKKITSTLLTLPTYVYIDDVGASLESHTLSAALTSTWWEDRMLGTNKQIRIPQRACWMATGNNLHLKMDIARRTVTIRIDRGTATPWTFERYKHPHIREWCQENRGMLVWACLTLVQHWVAIGKPPGTRKMGSFEGYALVVGGILHAAGIPGFLENYESCFRRSDTVTEEWEAFVLTWKEKHGGSAVTVTELAAMIENEKLLGSVIANAKNPQGRLVSFGKRLHRQVDRIYQTPDGDVAIRVAREKNAKGLREYRLERCTAVSSLDPAEVRQISVPLPPGSEDIKRQEAAELAAALDNSEGGLF